MEIEPLQIKRRKAGGREKQMKEDSLGDRHELYRNSDLFANWCGKGEVQSIYIYIYMCGVSQKFVNPLW